VKFLICPFLVVMGKKGRKKKEIIPLELVQYHQYSKCISFARARLPALLAAINSSLSDD